MMYYSNMENVKCSECNKKGGIYIALKDETELIDEAYVRCQECGYEYPKESYKKPVTKTQEEIVKEIVR